MNRSTPASPSDPPPRARAGVLALVGAIGGGLSGMFGIGGGVVMVPLLIWLTGMRQRQAAATSLAAIVPSAVIGAVAYGWDGRVSWAAAAAIAAGGVGGSLIGTRLLTRIPVGWLRWLFVALLVGVAVETVLEVPARDAVVELTVPAVALLVAIGVLMGIAAGLFGIGGGTIVVPALVIGWGAADVLAKGTSLAAMIPTALAGSASNARRATFRVRDGVVVGVAAAPASLAGVWAAYSVDPRTGAVLLACLIGIAAMQLAWRAWRLRGQERPPAPDLGAAP